MAEPLNLIVEPNPVVAATPLARQRSADLVIGSRAVEHAVHGLLTADPPRNGLKSPGAPTSPQLPPDAGHGPAGRSPDADAQAEAHLQADIAELLKVRRVLRRTAEAASDHRRSPEDARQLSGTDDQGEGRASGPAALRAVQEVERAMTARVAQRGQGAAGSDPAQRRHPDVIDLRSPGDGQPSDEAVQPSAFAGRPIVAVEPFAGLGANRAAVLRRQMGELPPGALLAVVVSPGQEKL